MLLVQILLKADKRLAYGRDAAKLLRCVIDRVVFKLKQVAKLFLIQLADALSNVLRENKIQEGQQLRIIVREYIDLV